MRLIKDLGMRYPTETSRHRTRFGLFECPFCENHFEVRTADVKRGHTTKCKSCANTISSTTHGEKGTRLYGEWCDMKQRCYNPNSKVYKYYGGRGITVCKEWKSDYIVFKDWALANGYNNTLTIDRKDNDGNYYPDNCRYSTRAVQSRNTRLLHSHNTSGYRGVCFDKVNKKHLSQISVNNKVIFIGRYPTALQSAQARDAYVIKHNLEHTLNFTRGSQ